MFRSEREDELLSLLSEKGYATVSFLSETLGISQSSIRRDLALLESKGLVSRSYGGVSISDGVTGSLPLTADVHKNEKKRIAFKAATLVKEGDTVFVDGSETAAYLFPELVKIRGITVITNSVGGIHYLSGYGIKAVSSGGVISTDNRSALVGTVAETAVGSMYADIMFFSADAVTGDASVCDADPFEVSLRSIMIKNSRRTVLLCDKSKLGITSVYRQCGISDINAVICDGEEINRFSAQCPETVFIVV